MFWGIAQFADKLLTVASSGRSAIAIQSRTVCSAEALSELRQSSGPFRGIVAASLAIVIADDGHADRREATNLGGCGAGSEGPPGD